MKTLFLNIAVVLLVLNACDVPKNNSPHKYNYNEIIGYIHQDCLAIKDSTLKKGQTINILALNDDNLLTKTKIVGKINNGTNCIILSDDRKEENLKTDWSFYKLNLTGNEALSPSFAIVMEKVSAKKQDGFILVDVNSDNTFQYFTSCTTSEGLLFTVWLGPPWKSDKLWSGYYYLGYDMEPSCPPDYNE